MLHFNTYHQSEQAPWIVFIHGAGGSSAIWFRQIRAFRDRFNILLVDLRGHGRSEKMTGNQERYTFTAIGRDVLEVLDHLAIRDAHFVGISLGTIIVRELAEHHPERVRSMILAGAIMAFNLRGKILMRLGNWFKSILPYMFLYRFFAFIIMPRKQHRESRSMFIQEARKLAQKEFLRWYRLTAEVHQKLKWFRTRELPIPTLYIMGEQDHMFLPAIEALMEQHRRFSRLVVVPTCGHVVNIEQPGLFNQISLGFLDQH